MIDVLNHDEIAKIFADKFASVYTAVPYNENEMEHLKERIGALIESTCCVDMYPSPHTISIDNVRRAISHLK